MSRHNPNLIDRIGQQYGRWTVTGRGANGPKGQSRWVCICRCGQSGIVTGGGLQGGYSRSCGCLRRETAAAVARTKITHGQRVNNVRSKEYNSWRSMVVRCTNLHHKSWRRYGGRGITVCPRWRVSFEAFLADVGRAPSPKHSIDRIDNDDGYKCGHYACCDEIKNVRWATAAAQANNRRNNVTLTYGGESLTQAQWAARLGIGSTAIRDRILGGWSVERTVTTPSRQPKRPDARVPACSTATLHTHASPATDGGGPSAASTTSSSQRQRVAPDG